MAINRIFFLALLLVSATGWSRETASPSSCQTAALQPAITNAKATLDRNPGNLTARFVLADAWSDAGCFNEAVQVLQNAPDQHSGNKELQTRLRVAKSLIGEEIYFDKLDRADAEAKLKRDSFRCTTLSDLDACSEAVRIKPDDASLLIAHADALARAKRPAEAIGRYRRAAALMPNQPDIAIKISTAEAQLRALQPSAPPASSNAAGTASVAPVARIRRKALRPLRMAHARAAEPAVRQYSNAEPATRSH